MRDIGINVYVCTHIYTHFYKIEEIKIMYDNKITSHKIEEKIIKTLLKYANDS